MVPPEEIMVLTYNRSAALEVRRRLWDLVGSDAAGVTIQTLHGLAMRLTGTSYAVAAAHGENINFACVIRDATAYLRKAEQGGDLGASVARDRVLSGLRHLLVDEYQDINAEHYELISAIAGRTLHSEEDKVSLMVVGDDDQNIYAFGGASVEFIRRFEADYSAKRYHLVENYRSTRHIIDCANRVIARSRERMKSDQEIRINFGRKNQPAGGEFEARDPLLRGQAHILESEPDLRCEVQHVLDEIRRLASLDAGGAAPRWGRFAVIARQWAHLEPMAAICRLHGVPVRLLRDEHIQNLHTTREGYRMLSLLKAKSRTARRPRVIVKSGALARWFRAAYRVAVDDLIEHPYRGMLAQFIRETESEAPGASRVVAELIESLYDYGAGGKSATNDGAHSPVFLLTAHRAKGLEFDHVVVLDGAGWGDGADAERRLFYVAATRARRTLTLCRQVGRTHRFLADCEALCIKTRSAPVAPDPRLANRIWIGNPEHVVLSWPGFFSSNSSTHRSIKNLEVGARLDLRPRGDGKPGWELIDGQQAPVAHLAMKFAPPNGRRGAVRVAAIIVREKRAGDPDGMKCDQWEIVIPEIEYVV